jgi:hypothetical protein
MNLMVVYLLQQSAPRPPSFALIADYYQFQSANEKYISIMIYQYRMSLACATNLLFADGEGGAGSECVGFFSVGVSGGEAPPWLSSLSCAGESWLL